ncbi:MAG: zinc ribbon domain-containing protein [Desulfobacterota bacterium]|nr:zinc ribbon domain-containing protein [Thermodesulfobacteriota bacterium]
MPIYEYECRACGETFEVFLSNHDAPVKKCQHCKSTKIRKLVSNCSFQLKGTGWYLTDYARKDTSDKGGAKKKEKTAESGSTSDTKKVSDTKPAEKAAA